MRAVIFDADGTTCLLGDRLQFLEGEIKNWQEFHDGIPNDLPNEPIVWLNQMLAVAQREHKFALLYVTARHEPYRDVTLAQAESFGLKFDRTYMRADNDRRPDTAVKQTILEQIIDDGYEPFLAIDDRSDIVAMWRSYGITTLHCAPDEPLSRYAGKHLLDVLVGPSGAGKSTYCARNYKPHDVVSLDAIREHLFGPNWAALSPEALFRTFKFAKDIVRARLENGVFTVIDATNLKQKDRLMWMTVLPKGAMARYVLIDRDYDEKMETRGHRSEELVSRHHQTMQHTTLKDVKGVDGLGNVMLLDARQRRRAV